MSRRAKGFRRLFRKRQSAGLVVAAGLLILSGCRWLGGDRESCATREPMADRVPVSIARLDTLLPGLSGGDTAGARALMAAHSDFTSQFLLGLPGSDTASAVDMLLEQASDPYLDTMARDARKVFGDVSSLEGELTDMFARARYHYPWVEVPKVATIVSGFSVDLYWPEGLLLIGLEHFMPPDQGFYESPAIPRYIRVRRRPETIAPSVALLLADRIMQMPGGPAGDGADEAEAARDLSSARAQARAGMADRTLDAMIRWGKVYYLAQRLLPCTPPGDLIGYADTTLAQLDDRAVREVIWAHFVERRLLYQTNSMVTAKYVGERPRVQEIGDRCPGRIGQWLGWQIVEAYARQSGRPLPEIITEPDADKILTQSRWRP